MKSLTLHGLDEGLASAIKRRAQNESISMNELVKRLLAEALGLKYPSEPPHREDFAPFCGCWTEEEVEEFAERVAEMDRVDPGDWQ